MSTTERRIEYAGSVHDEREIEAVVKVLRGGPAAHRIGKIVREMEQRVGEVVTSAVTFSTDIAPMIRKAVIPAFDDVTPDTYQIDVGAIEEMISPRTKAILVPNLVETGWHMFPILIKEGSGISRSGDRAASPSCRGVGDVVW